MVDAVTVTKFIKQSAQFYKTSDRFLVRSVKKLYSIL